MSGKWTFHWMLSAVAVVLGTTPLAPAVDPNFSVLQTFTNGNPMNLNMNYSIYAKDTWAFDVDYNGGWAYSLRRNATDGTLTYLNSVRLATDAGSSSGEIMATTYMGPQNIVYFACFMSHSSGDSGSKGIVYYQVDPTTGAFTRLGQVSCALGYIVDSGDPYRPWLLSAYDNTVFEIVIDPVTGVPSVGTRKCVGTGMGASSIGCYAITTDRKFMYCMVGTKVGYAAINPDNSLTYLGSFDVTAYDLLDCRCIGVSYDGRHLYVMTGIRSFPNTYGTAGIFRRNPTTGAPAYQETQALMGNILMGQLIFHRNNLNAFYLSIYYIGNKIGWMSRDPATGWLAVATGSGSSVGASPDTGNNITFTPDTGTLYGTSWYTQTLLVINTGVPVSSAADVTPPAAVGDLSGTPTTVGTMTLTWTAPGNDGTSGMASFYDLRYSTSPISDANWSSATQVLSVTYPKTGGSAESFTVTGLTPSTNYYFAIKALDPAGNWSPISNVPMIRTLDPDPISPAPITNLSGVPGATPQTMINLSWTATGDDGNAGTALYYDLRYSTSPITNMTDFNAAKAVTGLPVPQPAGSAESFTVIGLTVDTAYYFAILAYDKGYNSSSLSNVPMIYTAAFLPPPAAIADLAVVPGSVMRTNLSLTWTAPGANGSIGTASAYDLRYSTSPIIDMASFSAATPATVPFAPRPAGTIETLQVLGLSTGTRYYFAVIAYNSANHTPNHTSGLSNVPTAIMGSSAKLGDIDGDGQVNLADLKLLVAAWNSMGGGSYGNWNPDADFDADNSVNLSDLKILVAHWNT